ncbi:MAG: hypothetical protein COT80_02335 [Candidatus Buchananbacteria bacterium CG10_big_fil_rev_8_21_14_0_10_33_19]|uniref:Uncharacterized protein n=1 Tax=Candidatus Buchananbacteria bacterium CG10_big_fil_rev_8_21_14_0_10_33_19 TaxID=1974525 RepID=A0A2H0W438_9BACT|nr:MAG: hypothetical protein COT80_02335 [Candidatus Buchananbacteria bacterium CG10_big_fil_rev_8_21_14_0_10_33_19]
MAPGSSTKDILLEAVNLERKLSTISTIEELVSIRKDYFEWKDRLLSMVNDSRNLSRKEKTLFFQEDSAVTDMNKGGSGISFSSEYTQGIVRRMKETLKKWIDLIGRVDLVEFIPATYNSESKVLFFRGVEIGITKRAQNYSSDLLRVLFSNPTKRWATDEILAEWRDPESPNMQVYQAGVATNRKVAEKTGIDNFLIVSTKEIYIKPEYI